MILKSFYRKKSNKIYLIILIILFASLLLLNIGINILKKIESDNYLKHSYIYINSDKDIANKLENIKSIHKIEKTLLFKEYDNELRKIVETYQIGNTLVNSSDKLKDNEIIIMLRPYDYINHKEYLDSLINKNIEIKYLDNNLTFKVKEIATDPCLNKIIIAKDLFLKLDNTNEYIVNMNKKGAEERVLENINAERIDIGGESQAEIEQRLKVEDLIKKLSIANYVVIFIFIMLIIIIDKNIITDLKDNINLERNIGFKNYQIKYNVFKRISSLHLLMIVISLFLAFIFSLILWFIFKIFIFTDISFTSIIISIILISDLFISNRCLKPID